MDLTSLTTAVRDADDVVAVGGRTHWEVGGTPSAHAVEVRAPSGVIVYEPADLTVTVAAGTPVHELSAVLGEASQECALDPRSSDATVGGVLAVGLSGHRRLRYGPLRDRVLEVRFVTPDGRLVKGGGPTVKNVSGFDIPRLLVGSFGTIGVLVQVILRCQPQPEVAEWSTTHDDPFEVRRRTYRPSCIAWDGERTHLLAEGVAADVERERSAAGTEPVSRSGTEPVSGAPPWPEGPHRGRVSIAPASLRELAPALRDTGVRWLAEIGVGTIHIATDAEEGLAAARAAAEEHGGWLLREAGAPDLDGFGRALPNLALMRRIRAAFDPTGKLGRGRLQLEPEPHPPVDVEGETSHV
ncbi:MAG: FAD-binding protein [Acidimicrobiia bacterium]